MRQKRLLKQRHLLRRKHLLMVEPVRHKLVRSKQLTVLAAYYIKGC